MRVIDLDAQRHAVVARIQLNGVTHDVVACSLSDVEKLSTVATAEDVLAAVRVVVPTLPEDAANLLTFQMAKAILETAVGVLPAGGATPKLGGLCS